MELEQMLLIYINGNLIENMIIQDNMLLFSDVDSDNETIYKRTPTNEYEENSPTYLQVQSILYDVLEFGDESNIDAFKELCIMQCSKNQSEFTFEDLEVKLEQIEDNKDIVIV